MIMEKPHRDEYENLLAKQEGDRQEFVESAHGEALEDTKEREQEKRILNIKSDKSKLEEHEKHIAEQIDQAIEILGTKEVFGPEDLINIWGIELAPEEIPEIPFGKEDLERAKELNQYLILRADKTPDGKPLTIFAMDDLKNEEFEKAFGGKILYSKDDKWKMESDFYTKETPSFSWSLTSKEVIPDSTSNNYLEQTEILVSYIKKEVFKEDVLPEEYQEAITEFESKKEEIQKLMKSDWKKAAKELGNLKITQLTRQTPAEVFFDGISYFLKNKKKLLEYIYTWTSRRNSDGRLVYVGGAASDGASVYGDSPDDPHSSLGVSFSRRI